MQYKNKKRKFVNSHKVSQYNKAIYSKAKKRYHTYNIKLGNIEILKSHVITSLTVWFSHKPEKAKGDQTHTIILADIINGEN